MVPPYSADVRRAAVQTVVAAGASASVIITVARTYAGLATGHSASSIYTLYLTMKSCHSQGSSRGFVGLLASALHLYGTRGSAVG